MNGLGRALIRDALKHLAENEVGKPDAATHQILGTTTTIPAMTRRAGNRSRPSCRRLSLAAAPHLIQVSPPLYSAA